MMAGLKRAALLLSLLLTGCGAARGLQPAAGEQLPVARYGATTTATAGDLLAPQVQARPGRSDDLLRKSQERRSDEFDLPPT